MLAVSKEKLKDGHENQKIMSLSPVTINLQRRNTIEKKNIGVKSSVNSILSKHKNGKDRENQKQTADINSSQESAKANNEGREALKKQRLNDQVESKVKTNSVSDNGMPKIVKEIPSDIDLSLESLYLDDYVSQFAEEGKQQGIQKKVGEKVGEDGKLGKLGAVGKLGKSVSGHKAVDISSVGEPFASGVDLPFQYLESSSDGSAKAEIHKTKNGTVRLWTLRGDPFLRAVLFKRIKECSKEMFLNMFKAFGRESFMVHLKVVTDERIHSTVQMDIKSVPYEKGFEVEVTRFSKFYYRNFGKERKAWQPHTLQAEMEIEDEHSLRAKAWDRADIKKYKNSLAYRKVIRNMKLFD